MLVVQQADCEEIMYEVWVFKGQRGPPPVSIGLYTGTTTNIVLIKHNKLTFNFNKTFRIPHHRVQMQSLRKQNRRGYMGYQYAKRIPSRDSIVQIPTFYLPTCMIYESRTKFFTTLVFFLLQHVWFAISAMNAPRVYTYAT